MSNESGKTWRKRYPQKWKLYKSQWASSTRHFARYYPLLRLILTIKEPAVRFLRCYMCDYAVLSSDEKCLRCGWVVDIHKAEIAAEKYNK